MNPRSTTHNISAAIVVHHQEQDIRRVNCIVIVHDPAKFETLYPIQQGNVQYLGLTHGYYILKAWGGGEGNRWIA